MSAASLANVFKMLLPDIEVEPLRDESRCTACDATDRDTKICERCRRVCYCSRECQRNHWRARHKGDCQPREARVAQVLELANGRRPTQNEEEQDGVDWDLKPEVVGAALEVMGERVHAAYLLLVLLKTGGMGFASDELLCEVMYELTGRRLTLAELCSVRGLDPQMQAVHAKVTSEKDARAAAKEEAMQPVLEACTRLHALMEHDWMPIASVARYSGPDRPHRTNADLLDYLHAQVLEHGPDKALRFLYFVEHCLEPPYLQPPPQALLDTLRDTVRGAFIQYSRALEGPAMEDATDGEHLEIARKRAREEFKFQVVRSGSLGRSRRAPRQQPGGLEGWRRLPGTWDPASKRLAPGQAPLEVTVLGATRQPPQAQRQRRQARRQRTR